MKFYMKQLLCLSLCMASISAWSATVVGFWQTIDDETEKPKSIVELYEKDGKVFGKVTDLITKPDDSVCKKCKGDLKGKPIVGMDIVTGLSAKDDAFQGGEILDPAKGKVYDAKIWLESPDTLKVRGYLGIFYRTQTWYRVQAPTAAPAVDQPNSEKAMLKQSTDAMDPAGSL
jgi:uncharacterized protein (DUF2147 family)